MLPHFWSAIRNLLILVCFHNFPFLFFLNQKKMFLLREKVLFLIESDPSLVKMKFVTEFSSSIRNSLTYSLLLVTKVFSEKLKYQVCSWAVCFPNRFSAIEFSRTTSFPQFFLSKIALQMDYCLQCGIENNLWGKNLTSAVTPPTLPPPPSPSAPALFSLSLSQVGTEM